MAMTHDEFTASAKKFCDEFNARLADTQDWNEIEALRKTFCRTMDEARRLPAALAEEAMQRLTDVQLMKWPEKGTDLLAFARAIERAHGIGGEE